jgi:FdhD protein
MDMTSSSSWRSTLDPVRVMQADVTHWQAQEHFQRTEQLTVEEPLEIRIEHRSLAVIMRTPGDDFELAWGFLFSEGLIQHTSDIVTLGYEQDADGLPLSNVINVTLRSTAPIEASQIAGSSPDSFARYFAVSSSCGLCGKDSIEKVLHTALPLESDAMRIKAAVLYKLAQCLRGQQTVFSYTGGLHAAGLFSCDGDLLLLREDVGRHNAVDKLIGYGLIHDIVEQAHWPYPYRERILLVSGRTSFEIVQKALLARVPCLAAISAPSSLAVELADTGGITLVGFLRDTTMNVYTHPERII